MNTASSFTPATDPTAVAEDKTTAIVSYLTLIGFIVAVVLHGNKKTRLGAYHLRQSLGLMLTALACAFAGTLLGFIPFIGFLFGFASILLWMGLLVFWVMGLIAAASGQLKPVPVLGEQFQKWFGQAFE